MLDHLLHYYSGYLHDDVDDDDDFAFAKPFLTIFRAAFRILHSRSEKFQLKIRTFPQHLCIQNVQCVLEMQRIQIKRREETEKKKIPT